MQTKKDVAEYYNECTVDYQMMWFNEETLAIHYGYWDEKTKRHHDSLLHMNNQLLRIANIKDTDYVLDAGCGAGGSSIWLAKEVGSKVVGIDLCEKSKAQNRLSPFQIRSQGSRLFCCFKGFIQITE